MRNALDPSPTASATGLRACDVSLDVGNRALLDRVSLHVRPGEVVGLLGPNGSGKSTLLRILARLAEPTGGTVTLDDAPMVGLDRRITARTLGYLPQSARSEWPISARETVMLGRTPFLSPVSRISEADRTAVDEALAVTDTSHLAERAVTTLSGGERMRVMLARVLAGEPTLLLLDEPVTGLDPRHQLEAMILLDRLAQDGRGTLVVLHDLTLAARFCHRVYVLHEGMVVAEGPPARALDAATIAAAFEVEARRIGEGDNALIVPWSVQVNGSEDRNAGRR
ncbi:ABC transporter ATP-binding protein [Thalassobaculum sp. OXR-137]|uniref:ABC transporter ATP-binding protein n=1 Tax=Thalassobaculum sp. OXR-137 TaxID=3100173 RepID=UPI002AC8E5B6|nr:ABC transporter ATP-binding protein [Thalassobaculum sp. OXR-137]WPZ34296.1 ABC transporter ATP-binding protein [Thalassobaculum sp. OXR-137]